MPKICACCTKLFNPDNEGIEKSGKSFCSVDCMKSYALDYELNRIATALESIAKMLEE